MVSKLKDLMKRILTLIEGTPQAEQCPQFWHFKHSCDCPKTVAGGHVGTWEL